MKSFLHHFPPKLFFQFICPSKPISLPFHLPNSMLGSQEMIWGVLILSGRSLVLDSHLLMKQLISRNSKGRNRKYMKNIVYEVPKETLQFYYIHPLVFVFKFINLCFCYDRVMNPRMEMFLVIPVSRKGLWKECAQSMQSKRKKEGRIWEIRLLWHTGKNVGRHHALWLNLISGNYATTKKKKSRKCHPGSAMLSPSLFVKAEIT